MTVEGWFWIGYGLISFVTGYFWARETYVRTAKRGEVPDHNLAVALFFWIVYGLFWPLWLLLIIGAAIYGAIEDCTGPDLGKKIGRRLFGDKS